MAWRLSYLDVSWDIRLEYLLTKVVLALLNNLVRERRSRIIHCHYDTKDGKGRIESALYHPHRLNELCNSFKCVVLALNWNQ